MNHKPDLFLSYAREDAAFALRLAKDLRAAGVAIWIDQLDIVPGEPWDNAIERALHACARMLIVLSPDSVSSENVKDEIAFALRKQKPIVPVLLQACEVPLRIGRLQHIDFIADYQRGLQRLLSSLGLEEKPAASVKEEPRPEPQPVGSIEKKPEPRPAPSPPPSFPQPNKKAFAWQRYAGAFALVAALAFVIWKGIDWSSSPSQELRATKKPEDSSATQRQTSSAIQPKSNEPSSIKKQDDTPTETKRENKPAVPSTTPAEREQPRVRPKPEGMVFIKGGAFLMGSDDSDSENDEKPMRTVIVNDFYLDEHEVTVAAYQNFISATGHAPPLQWAEQLRNRDHPVVSVSWNDAKAYAKWAGKRLPYEVEWEYASRGGNTGLNGKPLYKYPWSDEPSHERANYFGTEGRDRWDSTSPVKSFPATGFGLYDMAGNVWEWCEDWYDSEYYKKRIEDNPKGPSAGTVRVLRGGSWYDVPQNLRCANRNRNSATNQGNYVGIRCAQDVLF